MDTQPIGSVQVLYLLNSSLSQWPTVWSVMKNTLDVSMDDTRQNNEKTIKVTGVAADTTKDAILNYFENKRRSGGGEVEDVAYKTGSSVAYVTFVDPNGKEWFSLV